MVEPDGTVFKVVRIVATSTRSWEDAARAAVGEAAKTITDLRSARVIESDLVVGDGVVTLFRVKLELAFQLDRLRILADGAEVAVRRYLIIANRTLAGPGLHELVNERLAMGPAEFHILVPEETQHLMASGDPISGFVDPEVATLVELRARFREEAEQRLESFMEAFSRLGSSMSGEVGSADPIVATRRVMERSSFDEIIVSTLPLGPSRWLKLDLPARLRRSFPIPVVPLISAEDGADLGG